MTDGGTTEPESWCQWCDERFDHRRDGVTYFADMDIVICIRCTDCLSAIERKFDQEYRRRRVVGP